MLSRAASHLAHCRTCSIVLRMYCYITLLTFYSIIKRISDDKIRKNLKTQNSEKKPGKNRIWEKIKQNFENNKKDFIGL